MTGWTCIEHRTNLLNSVNQSEKRLFLCAGGLLVDQLVNCAKKGLLMEKSISVNVEK